MSDVSADVLAEGWVVPEDIAALSVFSFPSKDSKSKDLPF